MKITISVAAVVAATLAAMGGLIILVGVSLNPLPWRALVVAFALLIGAGVAWVHHRIDALGERMAERELLAYNLGKLIGQAESASLRSVPHPRVPNDR